MDENQREERLFTYNPALAVDRVNLRLLEELRSDPRQTMAQLGRRVGMSPPAVTERVRRLEEAGIIAGYRLDIDPAALGLPIAAYIRVRRIRATEQDRRTGAAYPGGRGVPPCHR